MQKMNAQLKQSQVLADKIKTFLRPVRYFYVHLEFFSRVARSNALREALSSYCVRITFHKGINVFS